MAHRAQVDSALAAAASLDQQGGERDGLGTVQQQLAARNPALDQEFAQIPADPTWRWRSA